MRTTATLLLVFLICTALSAQKCLEGDCQSGRGLFQTKENAIYNGAFQNGQFHGVGLCKYPDGSSYHGQWKNGKPEGKGIKTLADKTILSGEWKNGELIKSDRLSNAKVVAKTNSGTGKFGCIKGDCANGQGIFVYRTGAVYVGEFRNGEIHGSGVCEYKDGSRYEGAWKHRLPDGYGTKRYADGTTRNGYWKKGLPVDESGKLMDAELVSKGAQENTIDIQTGCVYGDCASGQGIYAYSDGSRYEGAFENSLAEGNGVFYFVNGDKYVGKFEKGKQSGRGKLEKIDGTIEEGEWIDGEFIGQTKGGKTGRSFGCIKGNCSNGYGTYNFEDGARYIGKFLNRLPDGTGTVFYPDGNRYEGDLREGSLSGYGTLFLANGGQLSGRWDEGALVETPMAGSNSYNNPPKKKQEPAIRNNLPDVKIWAVIIGVASYNHMPVLRYTDDDAYRIYAFLKSPEGGAISDEQIRILIDEEATEYKIKRTMRELFSKAGENDLVILYFSGHGINGAFLPSDFDGYSNKLEHREINDILRKSDAKYKLCIADACHSGSIFSARSGDVPNVLSDYYSSLAKARSGTALIMSSKSNETSLESSGLRQGVFSHFLIRGLKGEADYNRDNIVAIKELFNYVDENVRSYTRNRQSPMIQGDYDRNMPVSVKR